MKNRRYSPVVSCFVAFLVISVCAEGVEKLNRSLVAIERPDGAVFLSWRLLADDAADIAFQILRAEGKSTETVFSPLTPKGSRTKTCFVDKDVESGKTYLYELYQYSGDDTAARSKLLDTTAVHLTGKGRPYISIPLEGDYDFQKVGIADLNGKTPSLIMQRGTYRLIKMLALDKDFKRIWYWDTEQEEKKYRGQSAHGIVTADVDAATGRILWGHDKPTKHIHGQGMAGDILAEYEGIEVYGGERDFKQRWLYSAKGKLIEFHETTSFTPRAVWWDADSQKEVVISGAIRDWGEQPMQKIEGRVIAVVDCLGDWREEVITAVKGQIRIYTTTIPAKDRRVCLMQDHQYRMGVVAQTMGYYYPAQLGK